MLQCHKAEKSEDNCERRGFITGGVTELLPVISCTEILMTLVKRPIQQAEPVVLDT
jgi:hypothetical protein